MKLITKIYICFGLLLVLTFNNSWGQTGTKLVDTKKYRWLKPSMNALQFYNVEAIANLYAKWQYVNEQKLVFLHLGDSHLQPDVLPSRVRNHLHKLLGDGGRGFIFPYSTVKTYSPKEYDTKHVGLWSGSRSLSLVHKVPLGARGMSCRTYQANSSFTFHFKVPVPKEHDVLKIFCKKSAKSYDLVIEVGNQKIPVEINETNSETPYVSVKIPKITGTLKIKVVKNNPSESFFECYGLSLETSKDNGVVWHNAGVGGARYMSILYQKLFKAHAKYLEADVVILDFGTNDYLYKDKIEATLEGEIKKVINTVRSIAPQASIILTTAQDLMYRGRNIRSGAPFAKLIYKIAKETNCCIYDWYQIAGGQGIMKTWKRESLSYDSIHLTWAGAFIKGDMFFEAIKNTVEWLKNNPENKSLLLSPKKQIAPVGVKKTEENNSIIKPNPNGGIILDRRERIHIVKKSETLTSIAKKYLINVNELKTWNNLTNDNIILGQKLVIFPVKKNIPIKKEVVSNTYHIVKTQETLYGIAKKYKMTVVHLKKLNNLTADKVTVGQKLLIKPSYKSAKQRFHIVKAKETLYAIAEQYNVSIEQLKAWNTLKTNSIKVGQKLIIKN